MPKEGYSKKINFTIYLIYKYNTKGVILKVIYSIVYFMVSRQKNETIKANTKWANQKGRKQKGRKHK